MENENLNEYKSKIYKFISFEGLFNTINNKSLRYARTDTFNDPLDASSILFPISKKDLSVYEGYDYKTKEVILTKNNIFLSSNIYVCSFTKTYNSKESYLMWSHYGRHHTQVCFEIDFSNEDIIQSFKNAPSEVKYPENFAFARDSVFEKGTDNDKGLFVMTNKSKVWSYEKEVRLIFDLRNGNESLIERFSDDRNHLFINFNPFHISKIIFGLRASYTNMSKTKNYFDKIGHKPKYEKMGLSATNLDIFPEKFIF